MQISTTANSKNHSGESPLTVPPLEKLYLCEDSETADFNEFSIILDAHNNIKKSESDDSLFNVLIYKLSLILS